MRKWWVYFGKDTLSGSNEDLHICLGNVIFRCFFFSQTVSFLITNGLSLEMYNFSVQFSYSVVSDSLQPHELQHARPSCPSPTLGVHLNPCPLTFEPNYKKKVVI